MGYHLYRPTSPLPCGESSPRLIQADAAHGPHRQRSDQGVGVRGVLPEGVDGLGCSWFCGSEQNVQHPTPGW